MKLHQLSIAGKVTLAKCGAVIAIIGLVLLSFVCPVSAVEIVVNKDVQITQVNHNELQAIFTMRIKAWPDGQPIRVYVLGDSVPEHIEFSKKILDIFPYQLRRYWDRLVFSGTGQAPIELSSTTEMYNRISTTPGAIGYLPTEQVGMRVKTIKVNNP